MSDVKPPSTVIEDPWHTGVWYAVTALVAATFGGLLMAFLDSAGPVGLALESKATVAITQQRDRTAEEDTFGSAEIPMTAGERKQWRALPARPEKRAEVAEVFATAFGSGPASTDPSPVESSGGIVGASFPVQPVLAYGYNGHAWMTASYADMAAGAIWIAVRYCSSKLPSWLCSYAGNKLTEWARGWGSASNHGVWAALYWNGSFQGGRW